MLPTAQTHTVAEMKLPRVVLAAVLGVATPTVAMGPALAASAPATPDPLPAFPGATGFGALASGGRGGAVYIVDTLEPFGPGSLGDALDPEVCRPRIVVFAVSGVIEVPGRHDLELTCGNVTIAGQTAPGAGITVHGRLDGYGADPAGNVIIRHVRFRPPPISAAEGAVDGLGDIYDALQLSNNPLMVLDHLSLSWGSDEVLDMYEGASDVTIQWTTVEVSNPDGQPEGPHNTGAMIGPTSPRVTIHHTLFAHHRARCPAMSAGPAELLNSVVYDCQDGFVHHNPAAGEFHIAGNTFVRGPSHESFTPIFLDDEEPGGTTYWFAQNEFRAPGQFAGVADDLAATPLAAAVFSGADPSQVLAGPSDFTGESNGYRPTVVEPPAVAFAAVLTGAGAFPRDAVTLRTIDEVRAGTGSWDPRAPGDLLAGLLVVGTPTDADRDGIADAWEAAHGLDPTNPDDHTTVLASGYTAIETYVNELADALVATSPASDATVPGTVPSAGFPIPATATPGTTPPGAPGPVPPTAPPTQGPPRPPTTAPTTVSTTLAPTTVPDLDSDGDGLTDADEAQRGTDPNNPDTDSDGLDDWTEVWFTRTNPLSSDSDGDGLTDGFERSHEYPDAYGNLLLLDPNNPDLDGDGLVDSRDLAAGCSPANSDTDGDGFNDLQEVLRGTRCNDPSSF